MFLSRTMSDAALQLDDEAMLARLAACDLAAAERVHEKLMAAEDAAEIADLGRTYQRLARSLRQTLALKAKLKREAVVAERDARQAAGPEPLWPEPVPTPEARAHGGRVRAEVMRYIECEDEEPDFEGFYEIELDELLREMAFEPDFTDTPVEVLVQRILEVMGLPTTDETAPDPPAPDAPADPAWRSSA